MTDRPRRRPFSSENAALSDIPRLLKDMLTRLDRMEASLEGLTSAYSQLGQHVALVLQTTSRCPPDCPHRSEISVDLDAPHNPQ